ncbi:MAG TPA: ABC-2 family transporter protein [Candidatus Acidoferrales bacterium]|nr:ABC-2 family transporter protein [Candidatus Acidoferrales bacterium]
MSATANPSGMASPAGSPPWSRLAPYLECAHIGFVNILAFRLRYFTGIFTYLINVTVYYFIWSAVFRNARGPIAGYDLGQILTYVAVGWILRSFYWNTVDQEMSYEVLEGKIAMQLVRPLSVQGMWLARAAGESTFRLVLLTAPTALLVILLFPVRAPSSVSHLALFCAAAVGSFLIVGGINFLIGTCAIYLTSILALIRAKFWLMELLSGVLIPISFFPGWARTICAWLPFEHIAYTPLQIYLGKIGTREAVLLLAVQWAWAAALVWLGTLWWRFSIRRVTIHGG